MDHDTDIGGPHHRFPVTCHSAIIAARSEDRHVRQRAFESILASYWKPAYKYIRIKWQASNEDAKDLTQGFFSSAIEKNYFAGYDSAKASFQTFFRTGPDDQRGINGGLVPRRGELDGQTVIAYVCTVDVESIDVAIATVESNGGNVVLPKMPVPGVGWLVYCKDTEGNIFGMMQAAPDAN